MNPKPLGYSICLISLTVLLVGRYVHFGKFSPTWRLRQSQRSVLDLKTKRQSSGFGLRSIGLSSGEEKGMSSLDISIQSGLEKSNVVNRKLRQKKSRIPRHIYFNMVTLWKNNRKLIEENKKRATLLSMETGDSDSRSDEFSEQQRLLLEETRKLIASSDSLLQKIQTY